MVHITIDSENDDPLSLIGRSWGWVLAFGIATLLLGILVVLQPRATIYGFAILLGIWLFVSGLFHIVMAIADDRDTGGTRALVAVLGLLAVIIGVCILRHTFDTIATLTFLLGLFWIVGGLIEFFAAYGRHGLPGRGFRIVMGLLGVAAGIATLVVPSITLHVLVYIMGIWLMIYGLLQIFTSLTIRKLFAA
ncbi:MAG: HdeD family acid-resistance protein [Acidimicrobiales bacterium]|jgi:uncharacterized membrane protein HdeD (DUF308 family)